MFHICKILFPARSQFEIDLDSWPQAVDSSGESLSPDWIIRTFSQRPFPGPWNGLGASALNLVLTFSC